MDGSVAGLRCAAPDPGAAVAAPARSSHQSHDADAVENRSADGDREMSAGVRNAATSMKRHASFCIVL
eukprot:10307659-Prorocentrum_lima.AAC.1